MSKEAPVFSMQTLEPTALLRLPREPLPAPIDTEGVSFWFSGRVALWQAAAALDLSPGDAVAVPAFCCGSELEPLVRAGLRLRVFGVTRGLDPEPASFARALEGASAALVTHYFGFAADLGPALDACRAQGVRLIEDCAHALYTTSGGRPVGVAGDAAVFSLRKTLALPDGAALVPGAACGAPRSRCEPPPSGEIARRLRSLVARDLQSHPNAAVRASARLASAVKRRGRGAASRGGADEPGDEAELVGFDPKGGAAGMSRCSRRLLHSTDHRAVRQRRRENYAALARGLGGLPGIEPLFPELPDGACPLFLPLLVDRPDSLARALSDRGVGAKRLWSWFHPEVPWRCFPWESRLKRSTLGLPVHQSLRAPDLTRLLDGVRDWSRS